MTLSPHQAWLVVLLVNHTIVRVTSSGTQYVRRYYQLPPSFYGRHDTSWRSYKVKGFFELSATLGVSLWIKCIVAALHATWPLGAWWLGAFAARTLGFPPFSNFWGWKSFIFPNSSIIPVTELFTFFPVLLFQLCSGGRSVRFFCLCLTFQRYVLLCFYLFLFLHQLYANFLSFSFFFFALFCLLLALWVFRI